MPLRAAKEVRIAAALIFVRAGDAARGLELAQKLNRDFPADTLLQSYWLPTITAASEIQRGDPGGALRSLAPAAPYEIAHPVPIPNYYAAYLRGLAYLKLGQGANAAGEFQKILDHPGIVWAGITGALARLQLGRAYAMTADRAKAKAAYQDFLTLWTDADPDIPIYKQAQAEYAKLQ
jgi:eukaryotic-like serine/threonine-protein kinase